MATYAGIEIGGTKLQVRLEDESGSLLHQFRSAIKFSSEAEQLREIIRKQILHFHPSFNIAAIGVGFGGPVDRHHGNIFQSFQVPGWTGFPLHSWFKDWSPAPVFIENDANVAALGEAIRGAGKSFGNIFYVTLGSGVGSGFVTNGKLYQGSPVEMEFGHLKIDRSGTVVEDICSGWGLNKTILAKTREHPSSYLAGLVAADPGHESRHLLQAINRQDTVAMEIFEVSMRTLSFALSHVVHLLGPDTIIVGGGLSLMGSIVTDTIRKHLGDFLMKIFQPGPLLQLAALGEEVVPIGAIEYAKQQVQIK